MATQMIKPSHVNRLDIRCTVVDVVLSNVSNHLVFFVERRLDTRLLIDSLGHALTSLPIFAGRMTLARGALGIKCRGQGVPFSSVPSDRTMYDAIRSVASGCGGWLVDPVGGAAARWGLGPLCKVRVTHLADETTAICVSFHHSIGDMQTLMLLMGAWSAATEGAAIPEPVVVEDRVAYLDEHLPADGAHEPGVRCLGLAEAVGALRYLATEGRRQRTFGLYFSDNEIARMRDAYGGGMRLSTNDVVCGHISEALMNADPAVKRRTLTVSVNARTRCGLPPTLAGNILSALNVDIRRGEEPLAIAEHIRHGLDRFAEDHCDMRINQRFMDEAGKWRGARCVATGFDPAQWNPLITNVSGFGVHRITFDGFPVAYCAVVMDVPVAGFGSLIEGKGGRGLVFQMTLPPADFDAMSHPAVMERLHEFQCADDDIPLVHR